MRWLIAAGLIAFALYSLTPAPQPRPEPGAIDLVGQFQGAEAAEDAAILAAMADEIASVIEWDGEQESPMLTTGRQLDELRSRTREFVCRGESFGERQPRVRAIVGAYLEEQLGVSGGGVDPKQRAKWVAAYRTIARSARYAISQ